MAALTVAAAIVGIVMDVKVMAVLFKPNPASRYNKGLLGRSTANHFSRAGICRPPGFTGLQYDTSPITVGLL